MQIVKIFILLQKQTNKHLEIMSNIVKETNEGIQRGIEMQKRFTGRNSKSELQARYNLIEWDIKRIESKIKDKNLNNEDYKKQLFKDIIELQSEQIRVLEKLIK